MISRHEQDEAEHLVRLYDERVALTAAMARAERPTGAMAAAVLAKGGELDAACEAFRRQFYPRRHEVIVGLGEVMVCSRTRRSLTTVYAAAPRPASNL